MISKLKGIAIFLAALIMLLPVVHATEINIVSDANGNIVEMGDGLRREYNGLNQLIRIRNTTNNNLVQEFVHDPVEEKIVIKKTFADGLLQESVYYFDDEFVRIINTTGTYDIEYVHHEGQLVGQINSDGSKYSMHDDYLGSTSVITNQTGNLVENTTYEPYGTIISGGGTSRFDYTGKEFDSVTGDYDFDARRYDAQLGIFTSPDVIIQDIYNPHDLNHYSYVRGNPYFYADPDGREVKLAAKQTELFGGKGTHLYLDIVPDNPEDFTDEYSKRFTIGGTMSYSREDFGSLIIETNMKTDKNAKENGKFLSEMVIPTPEGKTDTQFIKDIISSSENYGSSGDKITYNLIGSSNPNSNFGNSNNAATSLLLGAGVSSESLQSFDPGGYDWGRYENGKITLRSVDVKSKPTLFQKASNAIKQGTLKLKNTANKIKSFFK